MKRFAFLLSAVACVCTAAFGQLLSEDFEYGMTAGDLTTVGSANWAGFSGTTAIGYQTTSLSLAGYPNSGNGGAATVSGSNSEDAHTFFSNQTTGIVYLSALVNISSVSGSTYFLALKDAGTSNYRARVFARDNAGSLQFGISSASSTGNFGMSNFSYNTTYLLVAKFNVDTGVADLFVLDTVPTSEPGSPLISNSDTAMAQAVQSVAFRQASGSPVGVIDGIQVATDWATSVPVSLQSVHID